MDKNEKTILIKKNYGGNSCHKLKALIKKNLIILKRNKLGTICEIIFPIALMLILMEVRKAFEIINHNYNEEDIDTENYIRRRSFASVDFTHPDINTTDNTSFYWYGIDVLMPFQICSSSNRQRTERPMIASIGVPDEIKQKIIYGSKFAENIINFTLSNESFMDFKSIKEMEKYIKDKKYGTSGKPLICFGINFEERVHNYNYSLHYFDSVFQEGIKDIMDMIRGPFDPFQSGPNMNSYQRYRISGYIYIMKCINEYILQKETNNPKASLNFGMMSMKFENYKTDPFGDYIGFVIPFFIVVAYMCPLCLYIYRMVSEKESGAKEGMKIMGLNDRIYYISYFLQFLVISIFVTIINTIILKYIYTKIPFYFIFFIIFLWAMNIFSLSFFFQSFIDSTKYALILSLLIYFIMYFISLACIRVTASKSIKIGLSFFPPVALEVGIVLISEFEMFFRRFHPKYFSEIYTNYSLLYMYLQLIIDFFLYIIIGAYLKNVIPHKYGRRKPFYYLCTSNYWCRKKSRKNQVINFPKDEFDKSITKALKEENEKNSSSDISSSPNLKELMQDLYKDNPNFESEALYKEKIKNGDAFCIRNIVKTFEDGKTAVNNVDLNFYKDEIFALLGHNGAGKTTLISLLIGLYETTDGNAYYDGSDILFGNNMDKFRLKIGICPQHDILFEDLTIKEHLDMFCIFKGVPSDSIENEVNKTLNDFQLNEIKDIVVEELSAGQKRQLSIAIALIGGSKVIFLDEPSSGMDITARRNLWEILKRQLEQKIIILTTHYMEEASVLGNRIGIINNGKMKCIGTPLFLIEKFGKYMSINIYKEEGAINEDIINYINSKAKDIEYKILSEEIITRIPKENYMNGGLMHLDQFFNDFDKNLTKFKIKSYSVSMPSLEDVFLNISSEDNKLTEEGRMQKMKKEYENDKILFETDSKENFNKKSKFCNDFYASFKRRYFLIIRDFKGFLMEVLCPIILVLIGLSVSKAKFKWNSDPWRINISEVGLQNVLFSSIEGINNIQDYYISNNYTNITCQTLNIGNFSKDEKKEAIVTFIDKMYEVNKDTEDSKLKEVDMTANDYIGYFGSLLMLKEENDNYEFLELINARFAHGPPTYTHYFIKQIIQKASGHKVNIDFTHYPMPLPKEIKNKSDLINNSIVVLFVATAFSLIPSSFITIIIKERINNSKHLMRVSGIDIFSYWIVNYAFELCKYYLACGICIFFIWVFDYYRRYLTLLYILYGPSMVSCTYVLSLFFYKEAYAQNFTILLNFLIGAIGSITILMFRGLENMKKTGKVLEYIFSILPSFCFDFGYDLLLNRMNIFLIDYKNNWMFLTDADLLKKKNLLLIIIIYFVIDFIIYTFLLYISEKFTYVYGKPPNIKLETNIQDSLVLKEIEKVNTIIVKSENIISNEYEYPLILKNIKKVFKKGCFCCRKEKIAIKNLNFCVEKKECFGLLGLNGAGKTTTFKCITQKLEPSNGAIYINGKDTSKNFKEFKSLIGYCPQYDAIFKYMTVYENLEFYARIKGVKKELLDSLIKAIISEMSLEEYTKKEARKLSGGNKRKLSVAISLLCSPQIILLDEPSNGMDPEARRFMWSIIHKTSKMGKNSSIVMTTHSMDEAEALCKRMGIMVNGEFVCLGKASQIKDKYGYGYEINIRIKPLSEVQLNIFLKILNEKAKSTFSDAIINSDTTLTENDINRFNNFIYDNNYKINKNNIADILNKLNKYNYYNELKEDRLGKKIIRDIEINGYISLNTLLNWIFFVKNAFKFIKYSQEYFEEIILSEYIENNFLFKMKKVPNTKSIGFFFGLFEKHKEECFITEYSIQPTSLEQIFNKFAQDQISIQNKKKSKNNNLIIHQYEILVNEDLFQQLLD